MNVYKLNYLDKETAIKDFIEKGVYIEVEITDKEIFLSYGKGILAVVEIGKIFLTNETDDDEFKEITATIFADGYAYDVMSEQELDFGKNEVFPKNPIHGFAI